MGLLVFHIVCMILSIALCWCWQSLLTVGGNLLPHIETALDITTVAWCCRKTKDILHPAECPQGHANFAVTVDSKCLHCLISCRKLQQSVCWRLMSRRVMSRSRLCRTITHDQWFPQCDVAELLFYKNRSKFSATAMMKRMQNIFLRILCREVPLECVQPFIRGIRWDFREIWYLAINLLNWTVFYLSLLVGQSVLLICVSYDNLHQFTYVKLSVSQCFRLQRFLIKAF